MEAREKKARAAIENLLFRCAGGRSGQSLLIVHESDEHDYYDQDLHESIADHAKALGFYVEFFPIRFDPEIKAIPEELEKASKSADHTVFLARLADQVRFVQHKTFENWIISYALDQDMLFSDFGVVDYQGFVALKNTINSVMKEAAHITVTCPAGTHFSGNVKDLEPEQSDVHVKRFPLSIFTPLTTENFEGRIAQNGFLVGTGSQYYTPYACALKNTLFIEFSGHRITDFNGDKADTDAAKRHYEFVAETYDIDPFYIHSWHAGMHPSCSFDQPASASFERWSGAAFGNPRLLHFHTCGKFPPGEISLNLVDPTVTVDGEKIWDAGVLHPQRLPAGNQLLEEFPSLVDAFLTPAKNIGLGQAGRLSYF